MAEPYLVDRGVFARWFVPQPGWQHARQVRDEFLAGAAALETVDFVRIEVGNVLRKAALLRKVIDEDAYVAAVRAVDDLRVVVHVTDTAALARAAHLASRRMVSFYDALVVDRAMESGLTLLTSDAKLCRAVDGLLSTELLRGAAPD